jgi:hypothetical protein
MHAVLTAKRIWKRIRRRLDPRPNHRRMHLAFVAASSISLWPLSGCGGVSSSPSSQLAGATPGILAVSIAPASAVVPTGGGQVFTASVTDAGAASTAVKWAVSAVPGGNSTVGTIVSASDATALYAAPTVPPSPATVTVTATSVADGSKSASASITITCTATDSISPSAVEVALGQTVNFTASFCIASGATVTWEVNGIPDGNSILGTISATGNTAALYAAPSVLPSPNRVNIKATAPSPAGNSAIASATVTFTSNVAVSISPSAARVATGQRATFTPTVSNTSDAAVTWFVNGLAKGNSAVGDICQIGSNPCMPPTGPSSDAVDYLAPASAPATNPITLTAISHADPSRSATAAVVVSASNSPVSVVVSPAYTFIPPSGGTLSTQQFSATITGSTNENISWSVRSGVIGQGCAGAACGSVSATGRYAAPTIAPSPNAIAVIATSQADPAESGFAAVALTNGPVIESIAPSSVMAGASESFPLSVRGANFADGSGSSSSVILLDGAPRSTTCSAQTVCTTVLNPEDVQTAGTVTIEIQNPGAPSVLSNPVPMVIEPLDVSAGIISLTSDLPAAAGRDVMVVEPTTAAASSPISMDFVGYLSGNSCGVQGSPLTVSRPASGSAQVPICVHGNRLDATYEYEFTSPGGMSGSDIGVTASPITGLLPNMIELQLLLSPTTVQGVRSLFVRTPNGDQAVATGMLEVK